MALRKEGCAVDQSQPSLTDWSMHTIRTIRRVTMPYYGRFFLHFRQMTICINKMDRSTYETRAHVCIGARKLDTNNVTRRIIKKQKQPTNDLFNWLACYKNVLFLFFFFVVPAVTCIFINRIILALINSYQRDKNQAHTYATSYV